MLNFLKSKSSVFKSTLLKDLKDGHTMNIHDDNGNVIGVAIPIDKFKESQ